MPATEQTWRDVKRMHLVFAVSGLAMLFATLWMLYADYNREWKGYQRPFQRIENWSTQARLSESTSSEFESRRRQLEADLAETRSQLPDRPLVDRFLAALAAVDPPLDPAPIEQAYSTLRDNPSEANRAQFLDALQAAIRRARFIEDSLAVENKKDKAIRDEAVSLYSLDVGNSVSAEQLAARQQQVDEITAKVNENTARYQAALTNRKALDAALAEIVAPETAAAKALADHDASVEQLQKTYATNTNPLRDVLTLPILDAFNTPLKINQIWLPELTRYNNFQEVARFDRCTTCHQGIDKTAPGSAVLPAYQPQQNLKLTLATPETPPEPPQAADGTLLPVTLTDVYGMELAPRGLLDPDDVTIEVVWPDRAAARAQLQAGDVIEFINDVKILNRALADRYLLQSVNWGTQLELRVRRGLPHPFSSHPRLDLFVGSLSPHKVETFGCTICHGGQGSATAFKWASHAPDSIKQRDQWALDHGWFDNHHWIFPMQPNRFTESSCLQCHHEVTDLEPSPRFPEPPAPKLMEGYHLIRRYGCFGCHEINGFEGRDVRVGPDLRLEPNYTAAAQQLLVDPALPEEARQLARQLVHHPEDDASRRLLLQWLESVPRQDAEQTEAAGKVSDQSRQLASVLADVEAPGTLRKTGPSLRFVESKLPLDFMLDWIADPTRFRPNTRMPQVFGQHGHLQPGPKLDAAGHPVMQEVVRDGRRVSEPVLEESPGLQESLRFEPVEIRAAAEYLLAASQPFEYLSAQDDATAEPDAERGEQLFQIRGCLACHSHSEFPEITANQGPDLSRMGAKLSGEDAGADLYGWTEKGAHWLYSWVRQPNLYHARTVMPDVFLDVVEVDGEQTDTAADITAYLLDSQQEWQPQPVAALDENALADLALMYLKDKFTIRQSEDFLQSGIPLEYADEVKGDEVLLLGELTDQNRLQKQLQYVGKRTINKYGCYACHDIPGFEDAKPIGTALANWARKDLSQLAFEQVDQYVQRHGEFASHGGGGDAHGHGIDLRELPAGEGLLLASLLHHQREGFLWQKLREPRSYDYKKTENKGYNERLRMPNFPFDQQQIEAVMTFVLGLVADPPAAKYLYDPSPAQRAIVQGRKTLEKFNCAGCHELETEQWLFEFDPNSDEFAAEKPFPPNEYHFFNPHFSPAELAASRAVDRRGMGQAWITGRVFVGEDGEPQEAEDEEGNLLRSVQLWKAAPINGQTWLPLDQVLVAEDAFLQRRPPVGGDFARYVHSVALELEREVNPAAKYQDAWGWVPPPLPGEGGKVQPGWLHSFLLDPYPIRPAAVLRMPKFNMSPDESRALVDYFAAVDGVDYPYEFDARTSPGYLASQEAAFPGRLDDALRIITNANYCIKCHLIGDFNPKGSERTKAPNLAHVHSRFRGAFLQPWLANPARVLPYSGMPVNFPLDKPVSADLFQGEAGPVIQHGGSAAQLESVIDFLLNYNGYTERAFSVAPLVQLPPEAEAGAEGAEDNSADAPPAADPEESEPED